MSEQEGTLTTAQFEILRLLWNSDAGLTVAEIWAAVCGGRDVSRTTVLNLVDRLEKRKWLRREKVDGVFRYKAQVDRATTESQLAAEFVGEFFDGSPSSFVISLLGSKRISQAEVKRLRAMLDELASSPKQRNGKGRRLDVERVASSLLVQPRSRVAPVHHLVADSGEFCRSLPKQHARLVIGLSCVSSHQSWLD